MECGRYSGSGRYSIHSPLDSYMSPSRLFHLTQSFERKNYFDSETQLKLLAFWNTKRLSLWGSRACEQPLLIEHLCSRHCPEAFGMQAFPGISIGHMGKLRLRKVK